MAPQLAATSPARKRFLREARSSAQVRHENVVQVYEVAEQPLPYLVMEFIPGETLQQKLDRVGPLEVPETLRIGRQIAEGLAAAHATDLIHRDIKPGNVLLEGGHHKVKITDFGLARTADDASISQSGIIAGTPMYMAPEQTQGQTLDQRADLFSLGSVLYQMVAGRPPFRANSAVAVLKRVAEDRPRPIREIIPETPQWLCDIIAKLHAKDPDERYQSAREVADVLADCEAQLKANAKLKDYSRIPRSQPQQSTPRLRLRRRRWAAAAAVLLLLLGGLGFTEATGVTNVRGTVIRLFSPEGTLVVEVDDPGVSVAVDGADVIITGAGAKEIRLKPGSYTVEARKDGKLVSRELVTVTKNGKQIVRVSQEPVTVPKIAAEKKDADRRAAEYVLSIGGTVCVNGEERNIRAVTELPQGAFRLTFVHLKHNKQVTDAGLAAFDNCSNVTELYLNGCTQVTDAGLAHFKDCKGLTLLGLNGMNVADGLAAFKNSSLTILRLDMENARVTDAGLAYLKGWKNLRQITLLNTGVTDAGLAHLKDCKNLVDLDLRGTRASDTGLAYFIDCKNLSLLRLGGTSITDAGLALFEDCKNLIELELSGTSITDEGSAHLKGHKKLAILYLGDTPVTDAGLAHLAGLKGLTVLALNGTKVSDQGLAHLKGMPLKVLLIDNTGITDLTPLQGMPLEDIRLTPKNITKGLDILRDMKSLKTIGLRWQRGWPTAEFWERYDKGEFKE